MDIEITGGEEVLADVGVGEGEAARSSEDEVMDILFVPTMTTILGLIGKEIPRQVAQLVITCRNQKHGRVAAAVVREVTMKRESEDELGVTAWIARTVVKDEGISTVAARVAAEVAVKVGAGNTERSIGAAITTNLNQGKRRKGGKSITTVEVERCILIAVEIEV